MEVIGTFKIKTGIEYLSQYEIYAQIINWTGIC